MHLHHVRTHRSDENLAREDQLAWKIAGVAADPVELDDDVVDMVINRIIDNAAVAAAAISAPARRVGPRQALAPGLDRRRRRHRVRRGRRTRFSPEWAAWANGVAVRELDFHDTFLAADYSHPGDNIPPILAVAQQLAAKRGLRARSRPRHRHRLRDPDRPRQGDLPARAQDRPRRPPRPLGRRRHRHAARPGPGDDLPGDRPGAAHDHRHPPVPQGRDLDLEGVRPRLRRQAGDRGRRPRDARREARRPRSTRARTA